MSGNGFVLSQSLMHLGMRAASVLAQETMKRVLKRGFPACYIRGGPQLGCRRLYDTAESKYVALDDIKRLVLNDVPLNVVDAKTGEDFTRRGPTVAGFESTALCWCAFPGKPTGPVEHP